MKHPYADILIAIAEGKEIQIRDRCDTHNEWLPCQNNLFFANMNASRHQHTYRIKPALILINGVECESPVKNGVYTLDVGITRFVFATAEARDAAYAALIKPFGDQA